LKEHDSPIHQEIKQFRYQGSSMHPTFKAGQVLYVRPKIRGIQAGDVIVFESDDEFVVHRVRSVTKNGVHTRGDNNPGDDRGLIPFERIVGVVDEVNDWGKVQKVSGGGKGLRFARFRWILNGMFRRILPGLGAPYRWLKGCGLIQSLWRPRIVQMRLKTSKGTIIKYLVGGKTVATWQPGISRFRCKKPYDLVIPSPAADPSFSIRQFTKER
jgi:signal peptidase I